MEMLKKILVVDDDEIIFTMLGMALAGEGVVDCAGNGRHALAKVAETFYDVLIVDMDMPDMNGLEFYKNAVRIFPAIKERIIFFTGTCDEGYLSFFRENNLRYLAKPSSLKDIKDSVKEILNYKQVSQVGLKHETRE